MQVNMLDAKNRLSSLVAAVEQGEEVILARGGVPVAKIVKYARPRVKPPGAWKGRVALSSDWDSVATNALIDRLFYGDDETSPPNSERVHRPPPRSESGMGRKAGKSGRSRTPGKAVRKTIRKATNHR